MQARVHAWLFFFAVVFFALWGAKAGFAESSFASPDASDPPSLSTQDRRLQSAFETLRAVGEASNGGAGGEEALRQACALAQRGGSFALGALIDGGDYEPVANAGYLSGIRSKVFMQGRSNLEGALFSACLALSGQGDGDVGSGLFDPDSMKRMGIALALDESEAALRALAAPYVKRFEIETGYEDEGFTWQALTVVALWKDEAGRDHLFTQVSMNRHSKEGDTYNLGLAWRRLNESKTIVYGLNTFFDHAGDMNHNRMSVGADMQTSLLGLSANRYFPVSDWKSLDAYWEERAASGWDVELQGRIPELPSWEASLKGYEWSSNDEGLSEDVFGYDAALAWTPVNIMQIEAGVRDEQSGDPELHATLRLNYKFGDQIGPALDKPLRLASVEERVYDKVRRENRIRTERRIRDAAYVSVVETAGANSAVTPFGTSALAVGQQLPRPFTITISGAGGSVARLQFRDGGMLTIGAGSQVRVEATLITLIAGQFQYVSGSTNILINVPGGTVTLHGTDVDVSTDGVNSVLRVRDGGATLSGTQLGSATLAPGEAAQTVSGNVATLASNDAAFIAHADAISSTIDRAATPQSGPKVAPYNTEPPRLTAGATTPGQTLTIGLKFNTAVTASGGPPRLTLDAGGNTRQATLSDGSGSDDLAFDYTLQAGDAGASSITVQALDLNGATLTGNNGKAAVATIADTVLALSGAIDDVTAPSGYAVAFTTDPIAIGNHTAAAFEITGAEVGATYDYTITSSNGGTPVTGTGTIATATQSVTGIDVSGLPDGTLTLSLTLTDTDANTGAAATDTVTKTVIYLAMNFTSGAYQLNGTSYGSPGAIPGWTFTRAAPATTYAEDSSGNLVAFAANTPRITNKGLLIEGSRTNIARHSQDFDNAAWVKYSGSLTGTNIAAAPDGTMTADLFSFGGQFSYLLQVVSSTNSATYTGCIWLKYSSGNTNLRLSLSTDGAYLQHLPITVTSQWQRFCHTVSNWNGAFSVTLGVQDRNSSGFGSVYIWGAQLEQASFASSYIPTTNAAVTRSADVALVSGLTAIPAYTAYAEWLPSTVVYGVRILGFGGANSPIVVESPVPTKLGSWNGSTLLTRDVVDMTNHVVKAAATGDATTRKLVADGGSIGSHSSTLPFPATLCVGSANGCGVNQAESYLRDIRIYPSAKSDAELQALTAP